MFEVNHAVEPHTLEQTHDGVDVKERLRAGVWMLRQACNLESERFRSCSLKAAEAAGAAS